MDYMQDNHKTRNDVAEELGVSPQYVSKILSGKVNFSFKTISEIEECLGIEVFQAAAMEARPKTRKVTVKWKKIDKKLGSSHIFSYICPLNGDSVAFHDMMGITERYASFT